ncbi:hypothetical protein BDF14DRAFT_1801064 [Spinellus fusiger]|nr:hypothetical protein BDF14DRAFT_1801064 [Spinellus fusiger]
MLTHAKPHLYSYTAQQRVDSPPHFSPLAPPPPPPLLDSMHFYSNTAFEYTTAHTTPHRPLYILPPPTFGFHLPPHHSIPYPYSPKPLCYDSTSSPTLYRTAPQKCRRTRPSNSKESHRYRHTPFQTRQTRQSTKEEEQPRNKSSIALTFLVSPTLSDEKDGVKDTFQCDKQEASGDKNDISCQTCGAIFDSLLSLNNHSATHQGVTEMTEESIRLQQSQIVEAAQILMSIASYGRHVNGVQ